ncbi:hypothetical protein [Streptomyces fungicidicus]|uniref:hypothetical protein n=1 Tax=Streptomyces fungicidicus TaxID=68203 RepID=UPI00367D5ED6
MANPKTYALPTGGTVEVTILRGGELEVADLHLRNREGRTVATLYRTVAQAQEMVAGLKDVTV